MNASQHPTLHRAGPTTENHPAQSHTVAPCAYRPPRDRIKMQARSGVQDSEFLTNSQVKHLCQIPSGSGTWFQDKDLNCGFGAPGGSVS